MNILGQLFGFRPGPKATEVVKMGALELLQSYGLRGYARPGDAEHESRVWIYHGVQLAQNGVPDWIRMMDLYLKSQGVEIESVENAGAPDGYRMWLNGTKYLIYPFRNYLDWQTSTVSSVQILNELLQAAGSQERGYILRGEEADGLVLFMTPETHKRVLSDPALLTEDHLYDVGTYRQPSREAPKVFPAVQVEPILLG